MPSAAEQAWSRPCNGAALAWGFLGRFWCLAWTVCWQPGWQPGQSGCDQAMRISVLEQFLLPFGEAVFGPGGVFRVVAGCILLQACQLRLCLFAWPGRDAGEDRRRP